MSLADVDVDADRAIEQLRKFEREMDAAMDNAAREITDKGAEKAMKALRGQGSVASKTGIRSLRSEKIKDKHYATVGRSYLKIVHTGSDPHTPEVTNRLVIWAAMEGWVLDNLIDHIEDEGTRAHPWMDTAFDPLKKTIPERVAAYARRNVRI